MFLLLGLLQIFSPFLWLLQQPEDNWLPEVQAASVLSHGWNRNLRLQLNGRNPHVSVLQNMAYSARKVESSVRVSNVYFF